MKIAIIGNGPSRNLYNPEDKYDVAIGCNFVHVPVDYTVIVDAYAARRLRVKQDMHHRLGSIRLVLGERCVINLESVKDVPAGTRSMAKMLKDDGHVEDVVIYIDRFRGDRDSQRFVSSGHAAFIWAKERWPDAEFDMFGFDSMFTGNEALSYTRKEMGDAYAASRKKQDDPTGCVAVWIKYWKELFSDGDHSKITFWGFEGDELQLEGPEVYSRCTGEAIDKL